MADAREALGVSQSPAATGRAEGLWLQAEPGCFYRDQLIGSKGDALSPRKLSAFRIESEILDALHEIKVRDGVPLSEQVRRALLMWAEQRGVKVKTANRRAGTRRKA